MGWLVGETLSRLGTSLSTFAYPLLILFATGSPTQTGIVAAAGNIGSLVTLLIGGVLADRYSRRMLLIVCPLVQAVVVGSVAFAVLAGHVVLAHVAVAGLVDGAVVGVTAGASRAALRRIVPAEQLSGAITQMMARDMGVKVAGPPLGGVLFAVSKALPFIGDAISYLAAVCGVAVIRRDLGPDAKDLEQREPLGRAVVNGFRFVFASPYLRFVAVWAGAMNMLGSGMMLLVILLVRSHGGGARVIGGTQALGSIGGILGALVAGWVIRKFAGRSLIVGLTWCMAVSALVIAGMPTAWGIGLMLGVVSFVAVPMNVKLSTYEMRLIPDAALGRVTATLDLMGNGLRWLAPLAIGVLVELTSPATGALFWGSAMVVLAVVVGMNKSLHVLNQPIGQVAALTL
jgi:MFS family permease